MHKLCEFLKDELKDLEKKADGDTITMEDVEYGDLLSHFLKTLKIIIAMDEEDEGYSNEGGYYGGSYDGYGSYARGRGRNARRDSRGRYSRNYSRAEAMDEMRSMARDMMDMAPSEETRQRVQRFMSEMDRM